MADKIARCPASANTTVAVRHPPAHPRDRSIADDVNTTNVPLALLTVSPGISFAPPLRFSPDSIPPRSPVYHRLLTSVPVILPISNSTFLFFHSSFDLPTSLFRIFSLPVVSISFDFFQPFSTPRSPGSLERAARRSFVLGRKKIVARRDTQRASPIFRYVNARDRTSERAGGRAGGRTGRSDCMRHEKNRPRKIGM